MARLGSWIEAHATGIHVPAGDFWIDPALSTERALITHGHSDHARGGHGHVLATPETLAIMRARYGEAGHAQAISYGRSEEHKSELQYLMRISSAVFCVKKKRNKQGKKQR